MFNNLDFNDLMAGLDPMEQVNALSEITKIADTQRKERTPLAIDQVAELYPEYAPNGAKEGQTFVHNGMRYQVQVERDYNFANHSSEYARIKAEYERVRREQTARTKMLSAIRNTILAEHSRLQPTSVKVVFKCLGE